MAHTRKYIKGPPVVSVLEAVSEIMQGNYLFWNDKPQHPGWLGSMKVLTLTQACRAGAISRAEINPEWIDHIAPKLEEEPV